MLDKENFSLNHILAPNKSIKDFINLALKTKIKYIEIRNDLYNCRLKYQE